MAKLHWIIRRGRARPEVEVCLQACYFVVLDAKPGASCLLTSATFEPPPSPGTHTAHVGTYCASPKMGVLYAPVQEPSVNSWELTHWCFEVSSSPWAKLSAEWCQVCLGLLYTIKSGSKFSFQHRYNSAHSSLKYWFPNLWDQNDRNTVACH